MQNPTYLKQSRHGLFYFVWPLPRYLRQQGKTSHIKITLSTRDPSEALLLSNVLVYHAVKVTTHESIRHMDHGDIVNLLRTYFYEIIDRKKAEIHKNGPLPSQEVLAIIDDLTNAKKAIKEGTDEIVSGEDMHLRLQPIIERFDVAMPQGSPDYVTLQSLYKLAFAGFCEKILSHDSKQREFLFTTQPDYLKAVQVKGQFTKPENKLANVIKAYWVEMERISNWGAERSRKQARDSFFILTEVLGKDFNTPDTTVRDARRVKDVLMRMPANRNKIAATRDLPFKQQLEVEGVDKLAIASINKHLFTHSGFFNWAKVNGYIHTNPFEGIGLEEAKGPKKDPFNPAQITIMLDELAKGADGLAGMEHQRWSVLIGLYTGARQNEIASLTPSDIKEKDGVWYFDITDEEEAKKSVKTLAAIRTVPIHSELLQLGIIAHRDRIAAMGNPDLRLLHELTYKDERWSRKIERWFNGPFLKKLNLKTKRLTYHSLRKTAITTMRRADVDNHIVRALVGHEPDGVTEKDYNAGFTMKQLQTAIESLKY
jgi:integrase